MVLNSILDRISEAKLNEPVAWVYGLYEGDRLFYIGSTVDPAGRYRTHLDRWPDCDMELLILVPVSERYVTERLAMRLARRYGFSLENRVEVCNGCV